MIKGDRASIETGMEQSLAHRRRRYMVSLGEIRHGKELGYKIDRTYIWHACEDCGKERWVRFDNGKVRTRKCFGCSRIASGRRRRGFSKVIYGYVTVRLKEGDFFYPMVKRDGYVLEHRLVMARHLNRCLLPWEIVHHKNGIRDDNRIENLELLPTRKYHIVDTYTKSLIGNLQRQIIKLEMENAKLKSHICI